MVWPRISTCLGSLRHEYQIGSFLDCCCSFDGRFIHYGICGGNARNALGRYMGRRAF